MEQKTSKNYYDLDSEEEIEFVTCLGVPGNHKMIYSEPFKVKKGELPKTYSLKVRSNNI